MGPFRRGLLGSTVCHEEEAHKLAAKVEHGGGWTVLMAIDAAQLAGQDWRPWVAEARQCLADEANRRRAPCIFLAAPVADFVRWDAAPGDAWWAVSARSACSAVELAGGRAGPSGQAPWCRGSMQRRTVPKSTRRRAWRRVGPGASGMSGARRAARRPPGRRSASRGSDQMQRGMARARADWRRPFHIGRGRGKDGGSRPALRGVDATPHAT